MAQNMIPKLVVIKVFFAYRASHFLIIYLESIIIDLFVKLVYFLLYVIILMQRLIF